MFKKLLLITFVALGATAHLAALSGADFLKNDVSARHKAMGGAGSVMPADSLSLYYNPALLALSAGYTLDMAHRQGIFDTSTEYLGGTMPLYLGYAGAGFTVGLIGSEAELDISGTETGNTLTALDFAGNLGYGLQLWHLYIGVAGKFIYRKVATESLISPAADIGVAVDVFDILKKFQASGGKAGAAQFRKHSLIFGTSMANLGGKIDDTPLPLVSRTGLWYTYFLHPKFKVSGGADFTYQSDLSAVSTQVGTEMRIYRYFLARAGINLGGIATQFAYGGGIDYPISSKFNATINYAGFRNNAGSQEHIIDLSLKLPFGAFRQNFIYDKQIPKDHQFRIKKPKFRVIVFEIDNRSNNQALEQTRNTIESFFASTFKNSKNVEWINSDVTNQMMIFLGMLPKDATTPGGQKRLAKATNAQLAMTGYLEQPTEKSVVFAVKLENVQTGEVLLNISKTATSNIEVLGAMDGMAESIWAKVEQEKYNAK